jgi:hypothetical protein
MSDDQIKWVVTADDKDVIAAFKRMQKELEGVKKKQQESNEETKKAEKLAKEQAKAQQQAQAAQQKGFDQGIASLAKMAFGWVSVQTAIQVASAEYQAYIDLTKKASDATISTANSQIVFFRNLGNVTGEQAKKITETIKAIASANKTTEGKIYEVASIARSSQGNLTDDQMFANVGMATRLAPESTQEAMSIAGGLNAASRLTGSADPEVNAGLLLGIGEQTRIESMAQIAKTLLPGAAGIKATLPGTSTAEAVAGLSTLTTISEDETGAVSRTAMQQLAGQLRKIRKGTDLGDEITTLQNDPKARASFLKKASFEEKAKPFIEKLLTGGTDAANLYQQNLSKVPTGDGAVNVARQFFENVGAQPYQQVRQLDQSMAANTNAALLSKQGLAAEGTIRQRMDEGMQAAGVSWFGRTVYARGFDLQRARGDDEITAGERVLGGAITKSTNDEMSRILKQQLEELRALRRAQTQQPKPKNIDAHTE